jgi:murein L,D-transpeptidase YafK
MSSIIPARLSRVARAGLGLATASLVAALCLAGCTSTPIELTAAEQPLSAETVALLGKKGMQPASPIYIRIFKEESELEVWKAREDGRFYHFKTYPICNWSGALGPKIQQGDKQAPEGFYTIAPTQMKPDSQYHVAFNVGYPNAYDRANGRTGQSVMVHGACKSAGCYAMTDALVEEIYALAREAFRGGQPAFEVHAFPFRMTDEKLARFKGHKFYPFWATLKQGYDAFEVNRVPPGIAVCERRYVVNVSTPAGGRVDPEGRCPRFQRPALEPFVPLPSQQKVAEERIRENGPKTRDMTEVAATTAREAAEDAASGQATSVAAGTAGAVPAALPPAYGLGFGR